MKRLRREIAALAGVGAICICTAGVQADPPTGSEMFSAPFSGQLGLRFNVDLPQFDDQGGSLELQQVTLVAEGEICVDASLQNDGDVSCIGTLVIDLKAPVNLEDLLVCDPQVTIFVEVPAEVPVGGFTDFGGIICNATDCMDSTTVDLGPFIGNGTLKAETIGLGSIFFQTLVCDGTFIFAATHEGTITIIYEYKDLEQACCLPDGNCIDVNPSECPGTPQGVGTTCAETECPPEACCLPDGNCIDVIPRDCEDDFGGTPGGPGTMCATWECPTEACCLPDGNCIDVILRDCVEIHGGTPQGPNTLCEETECPTEECCLPDGTCMDVIPRDCTDIYFGTPQGPGTMCDDLTGACCFGVICVENTTQVCCELAGGAYQGDGSTCDPNPCVPGDEGCTPGYWKQPHHFDSWPAPYTPDTLFSAVFEDAFPGLTLHDVLSQPASADPGPNQLNSLGRHTVAALLNAGSPGVAYCVTAGDVINMFNAVFPGTIGEYNDLKGQFSFCNEAGCPLNGNADVNLDGFVDLRDLLILYGNWNAVGPDGDIDENGIVDTADLLLLFGWWGS